MSYIAIHFPEDTGWIAINIILHTELSTFDE